jgi:uncharacterized protein (DUF305 family)
MTRRRLVWRDPMKLPVCRTITAVLGVALASGSLACGGDHGGSHAMVEQLGANSSESSAAPGRRTSKFEAQFLTGMIDHHHMAVMMAETCVENAAHEELRTLCNSIITAQNAEIEHMQHWLGEWYGITHEPEMTPDMQREMNDLAALDGEAFEVAFMEQMIGHHLTALSEGGTCLARAYHPELVGMCGDMVGSQAAEIVKMREWLCQWLERCGPVDGAGEHGNGNGHGCGMGHDDGKGHGGGMDHGGMPHRSGM